MNPHTLRPGLPGSTETPRSDRLQTHAWEAFVHEIVVATWSLSNAAVAHHLNGTRLRKRSRLTKRDSICIRPGNGLVCQIPVQQAFVVASRFAPIFGALLACCWYYNGRSESYFPWRGPAFSHASRESRWRQAESGIIVPTSTFHLPSETDCVDSSGVDLRARSSS